MSINAKSGQLAPLGATAPWPGSAASVGQGRSARNSRLMRSVATLAFGIAASIIAYGSEATAATTFTWDPSAAGLTTTPVGTNITADNFNVSNFADISYNPVTTVFSENAVLTALQFLNGGTAVALAGLQSSYSLYATVTATGTQAALPAPGSGLATDGVFNSASYTFWANPHSQPSVTLTPGGSPVISGNAGAIALFSGALTSGTSTLTAPTAGGYSPTANLSLSLTACTAVGQVLPSGVTCTANESPFFVHPLPAALNLVVSNFSASTTVTSLTAGNPTFIDINGGAGNITFASPAVPEPMSLLVLGSSLVGLGVMRRRRH